MCKARIAFIRHSITEWNEENRIQGQLDSPLTSEGIALAKSWRTVLNPKQFDAVITSDLKRTIHTAEIITDGINLPFFQSSGLREQNWGIWTGLLLDEIKTKHSAELEEQIVKGWEFRPENGESREDVSHRARTALIEQINKIIETTGKKDLKILVVAHEGVLKAVIYKLLDHDFMPGNEKIMKKRKLHWLNWDSKLGLAIESINNNL